MDAVSQTIKLAAFVMLLVVAGLIGASMNELKHQQKLTEQFEQTLSQIAQLQNK